MKNVFNPSLSVQLNPFDQNLFFFAVVNNISKDRVNPVFLFFFAKKNSHGVMFVFNYYNRQEELDCGMMLKKNKVAGTRFCHFSPVVTESLGLA